MTKEEIGAKVAAILVEHLGVSHDQVVPTARLGDDLGCDSLDYTELEMELEEQFGVTITDGAFDDESTVQTVIDTVADKLA